jgi:hypothetical protein
MHATCSTLNCYGQPGFIQALASLPAPMMNPDLTKYVPVLSRGPSAPPSRDRGSTYTEWRASLQGACLRADHPAGLRGAGGDMVWISERARIAHCSRGVDLTPETGAGIIPWSGAVSLENLTGCGCRLSRRRFPIWLRSCAIAVLEDDERERVRRRACIE